jgi:hypothetical protein
MADERLIQNGPGIDTKQERDYINYQPSIEYIKPAVNSTYQELQQSQDLEEIQVSQSSTVDTWKDVITVIDSLNQIQDDIEKQLKDTTVIVPDKMLDLVSEAARKYGYELNGNQLSFGLYKKALLSLDSHEKIIVVDAFENYYTDINGSLEGEIYPDVIEMKEDFTNLVDFLKKGVFLQFIDKDSLPTDMLADDDKLSQIKQTEIQLLSKYLGVKKDMEQTADSMRKLHVLSPETQEYFVANARFEEVNKTFKDLRRRIYTKNESTSLVQAKTMHTGSLVNSMANALTANVYKNTSYELLYALLSQYSSGQAIEKGLRKIQVLMKLAMDRQVEDLTAVKSDIKGIANNTNKKNVNNALVKAVHLRNEVFGEVYDLFDHITDLPDNPMFDAVADHIANGALLANDLYTQQSSDFYKVHNMDVDLRMEKLQLITDKDVARKFYGIIDKLIIYAKQKNGWAQGSQLSGWLKEFVQKEGLS